MRISVDRDDPGYYPLVFADGWRVWLDGVEQIANCITADTEKGEVLLYVVDKFGHKMVDPETKDRALTELKFGKVEIKAGRRDAPRRL